MKARALVLGVVATVVIAGSGLGSTLRVEASPMADGSDRRVSSGGTSGARATTALPSAPRDGADRPVPETIAVLQVSAAIGTRPQGASRPGTARDVPAIEPVIQPAAVAADSPSSAMGIGGFLAFLLVIFLLIGRRSGPGAR